MAKNIFNPVEIVDLTAQKIALPAPDFEVEKSEEIDDFYAGPTADDLRRESEIFKKNWAKEKEELMQKTQEEIMIIRQKADVISSSVIKEQEDIFLHKQELSKKDIDQLKDEAEVWAAKTRREAEESRDQIHEEARKAGFAEGKEEGWKDGRTEVERLIERFHKILSASIEKRKDIINEVETQLVELVLLIARKVVKVMSESQRDVVINNTIEALRKLNNREEVAIRVNLADLELTTAHTKDFLSMVEKIKSVTILEDSSVDKGGVVIETDFGSIDARISSQLKEIENKIIELVPLKSSYKSSHGS